MDVLKLIRQGEIFHQFQPLYSLKDMDLYGYEGFIRTLCNHNPEKLFRAARNQNLQYELDVSSIREAIKTYYKNKVNTIVHPLLFLNVYPSTLIHPSFTPFIYGLMLDYPIPSRRIVFELNEAESIKNMTKLKKVIATLQADFLFALDDVGNGLETAQRMIELEPDFIKLDKFISNNLAESENKQRFIQFFIQYTKDKTTVILEGIEDHKALEFAQQLGVHIGQGYLLGRPVEISKVSNKLYLK